jgi:hypothetical protein
MPPWKNKLVFLLLAEFAITKIQIKMTSGKNIPPLLRRLTLGHCLNPLLGLNRNKTASKAAQSFPRTFKNFLFLN